jgi:hypothetical protein
MGSSPNSPSTRLPRMTPSPDRLARMPASGWRSKWAARASWSCRTASVRCQPPGQHPIRHLLDAAPLDRPGGAQSGAVGIQQQRDQHRRVIRGPAMPVRAVDAAEGLQVKLVDHIDDEPRQVIRGQPIPQVRRQRERLIPIRRDEIEAHSQSSRLGRHFSCQARPSGQGSQALLFGRVRHQDLKSTDPPMSAATTPVADMTMTVADVNGASATSISFDRAQRPR